MKTIPRPGLLRVSDGVVLDQNLGQSVNIDWLDEWNNRKNDSEWPAIKKKK